MSTSLYILFGNPVAHSLSPWIHQHFAYQTRQDMRYDKCSVPIDKLPIYLKNFQTKGGQGGNITLPFKEVIYPLCHQLSEAATIAKAVNTFKFLEDGSVYGDNTDGVGFIYDITYNLKFPLKNKKICLLGAGGAARGILKPLLDQKPEYVMIANRTVNKAVQLAHEFSPYGIIYTSGLNANLAQYRFDLIINGTSASLQDKELPLPHHILNPKACCYDIAYSKKSTPFLQWAKKNQATLLADGLGMLVEQAAESFYIWRGIRPKTQDIIHLLRQQYHG